MRRRRSTNWFMVLLVLVGLVVFGPTAVAVVAGLLGLAIGLTAIALKIGVIALAAYLVVSVFRALFFGKSRNSGRISTIDGYPMDDFDRHEPDEAKRALDAELARVIAAQKASGV